MKTDPLLIQVGGCVNDTLLDYAGKSACYEVEIREVATELSKTLEQAVGSGKLRRLDANAFTQRLARDAHQHGFHTSAADVETEHGRVLRGGLALRRLAVRFGGFHFRVRCFALHLCRVH